MNLKQSAKRTFLLHLIYSILTGLLDGAFFLNEFVLIKSLKGENYHIAILIQFGIVIMLFSVLMNEVTKRFPNKKKMLRVLALFSNLPLLLFAFFPRTLLGYVDFHQYQMFFLAIFLVHYSIRPILLPAITAILKKSYRKNEFGQKYGYATTFNKLAIMSATFAFGVGLDIDPYVFVMVYPVIGLLGTIAIFALSYLPNLEEPLVNKKAFWISIVESGKEMFEIMKTNKPFRDFEGGFMLHGFGWMITSAAITIFFERQLNLNYTSIAVYKNAYNILAIFTLPFFGKLVDKIDPRKFAVYTFFCFMMHMMTLAITEFIPGYFLFQGVKLYYMLIISYIFYGLFAAQMALLWYIGSAYFCKESKVLEYQSIHLSLMGVRGLFAPLVGVFLLDYMSFFGLFMSGALCLALAISLMLWSIKKRTISIS